MTNSISLQNDVFFEAVKVEIAIGKQVRFKTKGHSMMPFIRGDKDDIVLKQVNKSSFRKGAILLVQLSEKRYVVHRVFQIKGNMLILRGDGNLKQTEQCTLNDVIAEIVTVIRNRTIIKKGSFKWNVNRYLWPSNHFLRRIFLSIGRKMQQIHENKRTV